MSPGKRKALAGRREASPFGCRWSRQLPARTRVCVCCALPSAGLRARAPPYPPLLPDTFLPAVTDHQVPQELPPRGGHEKQRQVGAEQRNRGSALPQKREWLMRCCPEPPLRRPGALCRCWELPCASGAAGVAGGGPNPGEGCGRRGLRSQQRSRAWLGAQPGHVPRAAQQRV